MKGMILAAGEGTRLRPLTYHTPKPMLPVAGKPLLEHTILYLKNFGVTNLAINLYHLPNVVIDYFGDGRSWGVNLRYSVEERLLGSAGGVKRLQDFFDETFIVYYGDIFTQANLRPMIDLHRRTGVPATMGLYEVPDPWHRGIVELDAANTIVRFAEKPPRDLVFSNLANAGIYVLEPEVLNWIPAEQVYDFGHDVFPDLLAKGAKIAGYTLQDTLIDIGLPEKYQEANHFASKLLAPIL
jgi:NDP-sugar pyrophosphorylase family protein